MKLLDSNAPKTSTPIKVESSGRFVIFANPHRLVKELRLRVSQAESEEVLKDIDEFISTLKSGMNKALESLGSEAVDQEIKNTVPVSLSGNYLSHTPALESGAMYIPDIMDYMGEVTANIAINSVSADLSDIQSKIRSLISQAHLNEGNKISAVEERTSNVYRNIMFFLTNDPKIHGAEMIKKAETTPEIGLYIKHVKDLQDKLDSLVDFDRGQSKSVNTAVANPNSPSSWSLGPCYRDWKMLLGNLLGILQRRASAPKQEEPYEL
jgi:hypothetical protein